LFLDWSFIYYESGDLEVAINIIKEGMEDNPDASELYYRMTAYLIEYGKYKEAFIFLENALVLDFEMHTVLYEFFPRVETQKALFKIIDQFRKDNQ
jgi:tetratricopeptide (TPR) repeat protein